MTQRSEFLAALQRLRPDSFSELALAIFRYQAQHNPVYARYLQLLNRRPESVQRLEDLPFLPISSFKNHVLITGNWQPVERFSSSGTTGPSTSNHPVRDLDFYCQNARKGFAQAYGPVEDYCILALLPAYLERKGSSLVAMAQDFIQCSKYPQSGFFLYDQEALQKVLSQNEQAEIPTILLGVSFALLDFAERHPMPLKHTIVMETGGMKGRHKELTREELHGALKEAFQLPFIHSEYGMTELFSQAYSQGGGWFQPSPTMQVQVAEISDPFHILPHKRTGTLQIIDLANLDTLSFIATEDLGQRLPDGRFSVLGRLDYSDIRGCNLMVSEVAD